MKEGDGLIDLFPKLTDKKGEIKIDSLGEEPKILEIRKPDWEETACLIIPVDIAQKEVGAIIDSGAQLTVISTNFFSEIRACIQVVCSARENFSTNCKTRFNNRRVLGSKPKYEDRVAQLPMECCSSTNYRHFAYWCRFSETF